MSSGTWTVFHVPCCRSFRRSSKLLQARNAITLEHNLPGTCQPIKRIDAAVVAATRGLASVGLGGNQIAALEQLLLAQQLVAIANCSGKIHGGFWFPCHLMRIVTMGPLDAASLANAWPSRKLASDWYERWLQQRTNVLMETHFRKVAWMLSATSALF